MNPSTVKSRKFLAGHGPQGAVCRETIICRKAIIYRKVIICLKAVAVLFLILAGGLIHHPNSAVAAGMTDWILPFPGGGGGLETGIRAVIALAVLPMVAFFYRRNRIVNQIKSPGFEVISLSERRTFIPLEDRVQSMDFAGKIKTQGVLRVSANLNKVSLSIRKFGYLMEDKNFRNALLVNRRRMRRTLLRDGDVLDLGDLTLLYRDHRQIKIVRYSSITPWEGKTQIKFERVKGPVRRGMPMLTSEQMPNRTYYMTKNLIFIGRSENNDLVIKSRAVYYQHAKIERVGGRYKLQDLSVLGNTFVNNRRVEQRYLRDGDEISIETNRFKFQLVTRTQREKPNEYPASQPRKEETAPQESGHESSLASSGEGGANGPDNTSEEGYDEGGYSSS